MVKLKQCRVCLTVAEMSQEAFQALHLTVKDDTSVSSDLLETLNKFFAPETLSGDCSVECEACQSRTPTTVFTCLSRLPDYLVIHLKRFAFDLETMTTVKVSAPPRARRLLVCAA